MLEAFLSGSAGGCEGGIITDIARLNKAVNRSHLLLGSQIICSHSISSSLTGRHRVKSLSAHVGVPKIRADWSENTTAR